MAHSNFYHRMNQILPKAKGFLLKYEYKIVLFVGFMLVSAISYEFGVLQGQKWQQKPLIIEKPSDTPAEGISGQNEPSGNPSSASGSISPSKEISTTSTSKAGCAYVGSKNSDKFYLPTCSYAKRVKPENLVCFKNAQEAIGQGRTESKCGSK